MSYLKKKIEKKNKPSAFLTIYHYKSTLRELKKKNHKGNAMLPVKSPKHDENSVAADIYNGENLVLHSSCGFKPDR